MGEKRRKKGEREKADRGELLNNIFFIQMKSYCSSLAIWRVKWRVVEAPFLHFGSPHMEIESQMNHCWRYSKRRLSISYNTGWYDRYLLYQYVGWYLITLRNVSIQIPDCIEMYLLYWVIFRVSAEKWIPDRYYTYSINLSLSNSFFLLDSSTAPLHTPPQVLTPLLFSRSWRPFLGLTELPLFGVSF